MNLTFLTYEVASSSVIGPALTAPRRCRETGGRGWPTSGSVNSCGSSLSFNSLSYQEKSEYTKPVQLSIVCANLKKTIPKRKNKCLKSISHNTKWLRPGTNTDRNTTFSNFSKYSRKNLNGLSGLEIHSCTMQSFKIAWTLCFST